MRVAGLGEGFHLVGEGLRGGGGESFRRARGTVKAGGAEGSLRRGGESGSRAPGTGVRRLLLSILWLNQRMI